MTGATRGAPLPDRPYSEDPETEASLRHSIRDAAAFSVMVGSVETYFSAFAIFLKASAGQVALIATLPNLVGSVGHLVSAWMGHRRNDRLPLILGGARLQAAILLPTVLLPLLFPAYAVPILLVCLSLYYGASHFISPQWMSLMGELVPAHCRGRFFAHRTALVQITTFLTLCLAGLLLHGAERLGMTAWGFGALFVVAIIARLASAHHLGCMREPNPHAASVEAVHDLRWLWQPAYRPALRFSLYFVLTNAAVGVSAPFFAVYMLQDLQFTYLQFMASTGISVLVQFLTLQQWGRIGDAMGNRLVLRVTGSIIPFLPMLWVFSGDFWYLLVLQMMSGFAWGGFSLAAGNILYELVPRERRATYQALQGVVLTSGVFLGSMLGVLVTQALPVEVAAGSVSFTLSSALMWAFLLSTCLRLVIAAAFLPQIPEPRGDLPPYRLVYRFSRFNAFFGLQYDAVARVRRGLEGAPETVPPAQEQNTKP